jgi:hypothetical protein
MEVMEVMEGVAAHGSQLDAVLAGLRRSKIRAPKPGERVLRSVPNAYNGLSKAPMEHCW